MGEVYRADDLRLGQPVALKFLPDDLRHDPVRLAQFHNEVRTARHVSHPNVCRVYDIGEVDGLLYFGNMMLLIAIAFGLTSWGLYTSVAGRLWKTDPLG